MSLEKILKKGRKVDIHVHMVGNGLNGSGARLNVRQLSHKLLAHGMLYFMGLPQQALTQDLDTLYLNKIIEWLDSSSLDAIVLLAQEWVRQHNGEIVEAKSSLFVPNDLVLQAAKQHKKILAGCSIHPARGDAIEELERCAQAGAVLMKCLPLYQNIDPRISAYKKFWQRMADLKIPLLAHTGGELSLPVNAPELADPRVLIPALEQGVTVIAAHAGTSSHSFDRCYLEECADLLRVFPNLYVDNSGMNTPLRSMHFKRLQRDEFKGRILHGSDLPIPISALWIRMRGLITQEQFRSCMSCKNILERDLLIKEAMGFETALPLAHG